MISTSVRGSAPYKRAFKKVVGGRRLPLPSSPSRPTLTRDQILDIIAAHYQRLGTVMVATMNDARHIKAAVDHRWVTPTVQHAVDALRAAGIPPVDATIGAFRSAARLHRKDLSIFVFQGEAMIEAKRIAGRCRGRKYHI